MILWTALVDPEGLERVNVFRGPGFKKTMGWAGRSSDGRPLVGDGEEAWSEAGPLACSRTVSSVTNSND